MQQKLSPEKEQQITERITEFRAKVNELRAFIFKLKPGRAHSICMTKMDEVGHWGADAIVEEILNEKPQGNVTPLIQEKK